MPLSRVLNKFSRIVASLVFVLLMSNSNFINGAASNQSWREVMLKQVNLIRGENDLGPLKICANLNSSAQKYATYMAQANFFSHIGKNGSKPSDRIEGAGYVIAPEAEIFMIGENIAAGGRTVKEVVLGWKKSKPHFENMISNQFTHVGFGKASGKKSKLGTYWVQNFGGGGTCQP